MSNLQTVLASHPPAGEGELAATYRLIAELLLYPEDRDRAAIDAGRRRIADAPREIVEPIEAFLRSSRSEDIQEYLNVLELAPPCPLYLGSYIFEEPTSCRGAGTSGRNGYMIELAAVYRHYGFELGKGELADFVPALAEFLAISLEYKNRDLIGLRRHFVETYIRPGLKPMCKALAKYQSPYELLIQALDAAVAEDIVAGADQPIWTPPAGAGRPARQRQTAAL